MCNMCVPPCLSMYAWFLQTNCSSHLLFLAFFISIFFSPHCLYVPPRPPLPLFCYSLSLTEGMGEEHGEEPFFQITTPAKPPAAPSEEEEEDEMVRKDVQVPTALPLCFVSVRRQSLMFYHHTALEDDYLRITIFMLSSLSFVSRAWRGTPPPAPLFGDDDEDNDLDWLNWDGSE